MFSSAASLLSTLFGIKKEATNTASHLNVPHRVEEITQYAPAPQKQKLSSFEII